MYTVDEIEDDQGISFGRYLTFVMNSCSQSMIFGNVSQHLKKKKRFSKTLCDETLYVGQINGCQKIIKTTFIKCSSGEFKFGQKCICNRNVPT